MNSNITPMVIQVRPADDDFSRFTGVSALTILSQKSVASIKYIANKLRPAIKDNEHTASVKAFNEFLIKVYFDIKRFNHWAETNEELNHAPSSEDYERALTLLRRNIALSEDMHNRYQEIAIYPGCFKMSNYAYSRMVYFVSIQRHLKKVTEELLNNKHKD